MTILFLVRRFYPQVGGVEKHVLEISKRLVAKGHKVIIIAEHEKNTNRHNYHSSIKSATITGNVEEINIFRINPGTDDWFKKFRIWRELWGFKQLIKDVDVIHCHDVFFWYLPFKFLHPVRKVYTTFHGYEGNSTPTWKAVVMHKIAEKLSSGNICVGDFLKKWYGTKPTVVTYGAVNLVRQKQKNIDRKLIIFLGRLETETGIMGYLKAFKKISKNFPEFKLDVLGDGSLMDEAKKYVKDNNLRVSFRGFVRETSGFIDRAFFVFTSRYLGILESMASKKYVLAIYNNKIKEDYLKMTPFSNFISISPNSERLCEEFNDMLLNDKKMNIKIDKAYKWVKTQTWEKMVDAYLRLWRR